MVIETVRSPKANPVGKGFRVRLRVALLPELKVMHETSGANEPLECFITQLIEVNVIEFRRLRLFGKARVPAGPVFRQSPHPKPRGRNF